MRVSHPVKHVTPILAVYVAHNVHDGCHRVGQDAVHHVHTGPELPCMQGCCIQAKGWREEEFNSPS